MSKTYIYLLIFISVCLNCSNYCNVYNVQEISGLKGDNSVVAWETRCGATASNSVSVAWNEKDLNLNKKRGDIFEAYHGEKIKIEKVSSDTVKIFYWAREIETKKKNDKGIVFIYEAKKLAFFENK